MMRGEGAVFSHERPFGWLLAYDFFRFVRGQAAGTRRSSKKSIPEVVEVISFHFHGAIRSDLEVASKQLLSI